MALTSLPVESKILTQQNHWSECGRATSVANSDAVGHPHRSVLVVLPEEQ